MIEIYENIVYFLNLTVEPSLLWTVLPLLIATIVMLFYFEKYKGEEPGWNSHVANSLVLLFVAMIMLRHLYNINGAGAINYINFPVKFFVSIIVLIIGIIILFMNFQHFLPEKIARDISSPLTLNLLAYVILLFVYSEIHDGLGIFLSLLLIYAALLFLLNLIKSPIKKLFLYLKKMKEKEKIQEVISQKKEIAKSKVILDKEEKKLNKRKKEIQTGKKKIKQKEKKEMNKMLKEFDKQKKQAVKLKRVVRKSVKNPVGKK